MGEMDEEMDTWEGRMEIEDEGGRKGRMDETLTSLLRFVLRGQATDRPSRQTPLR
jgi:hypothetical protein